MTVVSYPEKAELPCDVGKAKPVSAGRLASMGRAITSFPALLLAVLVAKVYWTCRDRLADPDIWWHLLNAEYIVTHHRFPNTDTRSFTTFGMAWMDHSWLSELIYYGGFRSLGLLGIYLAFASALAILSAAIYWLCLREGADPFAAAGATLLGGVLAMVGYGPRTQTFGWLCFTATFAILLRFRGRRQAPLWLLPPIFCLWINLHAGWLIGFIVFAIFILAGVVHKDVGRLEAAPWSKAELKKLAVAAAVSVSALFVNPFGYRLVMYPFDMMFHRPLNVANVQEFASINFHDPRGKFVLVILAGVFFLAFAGRKRWRIDDAALVAFVIYCGLTHVRFLLLAGIVLPPLLAPKLGAFSSYDGVHERRALNAALLVVVLVFIGIGVPSATALETQVQAEFPVHAVEYLRTHPQQGHMFSSDSWGGYLEWQLPQVPTFVDTRDDIFEYRGVLKDYIDIILLKNTQEGLDRYQVSCILYQPDTPLVYYLSRSPQWERIYADDRAVIYRRVGT